MNMKKFFLPLLFAFSTIAGIAQETNITLSFTGIEAESGTWIEMERISVRNVIKNCDTMLVKNFLGYY